MTKTLYAYVLRDLLRVGGLALLSMTVVMTVFSVIEPLRERGLQGTQILWLFGYTVPVMVSLTLPISAVFAASLVYGRLSQDNEFTACRASGVSTLNLLVPGLALGGLVTVVSLGLSNYVTPRIAAQAERAAKSNIRGLAYHQLRTRDYVRFQGYLIRADEVDAERDVLRGVLAADMSDPREIRLLVAPTAYVDFETYGGETYASFFLIDPAIARTSGHTIFQQASMQWESWRLPSLAREKVDWYDWDQLRAMQRDPTRSTEVRQQLVGIRRRIAIDLFGRRVAEGLRRDGSYVFTDGSRQYELNAPRATFGVDGRVALASGVSGSRPQSVRVLVRRAGRLRERIIAREGKVVVRWSPRAKGLRASIELRGEVLVRAGGAEGARARRRSEWMVGQLFVPEGLLAEAESRRLTEIYARADQFTNDPRLLDRLRGAVGMLRSRIRAEMHGRVAYGVSCCLLVALSAALGLIFRGGHVLTAFVLSALPAAGVFVLMTMGKEMVVHPAIREVYGLAAIWSGTLALVLADACVYLRLLRR